MLPPRNVAPAPARCLPAWLGAGFVVLAAVLTPVVASPQEPERRGDDDAVLRQQLEAVRQATERYRDHDVAVADGFELFGGDGALMGEHWYDPERVGQPLDLERPSTLQYLEVDGEYVLTGVAYSVYRDEGDPLPEGFAGDADGWHVHDLERIARAGTADRPFLRWLTEWRIRRGRLGPGDGRTELTMVHAWVWVENPLGVFAQDHFGLPYLRLGLPAEWAEGIDRETAMGVALAADGQCEQEIRRVRFLTGADRQQLQRLRHACRAASERVAALIERIEAVEREDSQPGAIATGSVVDPTASGTDVGADPRAVELARLARAAWLEYVEAREATLTAEQLGRLEVAIEHPGEHGAGHGGHG